MTTTFKAGDIVRRVDGIGNTRAYLVGVAEFEIMSVSGQHAKDKHGQTHGTYNLELVKAADEVMEPIKAPPVEEYRDPRYEAQLRANEDLNATLRRRKEQIASQADQINTLHKAVTETEARVLASLPDSARLATAAKQAGLEPDEAVKAIELGARFLALGYRGQDFDFLRELDMRFRRRFADMERQ